MAETSLQAMIPSIVDSLKKVQAGMNAVDHIVPFKPSAETNLIQGVLFLKPEATDLLHNVDVDKVLSIVDKYLKEWHLSIGGLSVMGAEYLQKHDIIAQHYGVINRISREGEAALSEAAKSKLQNEFGSDLERGARILGAHESMKLYPDFKPAILNTFVELGGFKKLAPGTYCTRVPFENEVLLLLSAFHPYQIEHFTAPQRAIIVLDIRCDPIKDGGHWRTLRNEMLGVTDPAEAIPGSLRHEFLTRRAELNIREISRGYNAVHFSAGPLEGMVETIRYFSDYPKSMLDIAYTCFGQLLLNNGFDPSTIKWLMSNPQLNMRGTQVPAFDLCEEIQPQSALTVLMEAIGNKTES